jgi:hypothetical protein
MGVPNERLFGHLGSALGLLGLFGLLGTWAIGLYGSWALGLLGSWALGHLDYGPMDSWAFGL